MTPKQIFTRTLPFVWAKLLLGLALVVASAILFALFTLFASLFNSGAVYTILIIIWFGAVGTMRYLLMHYLGYLVKAGHVAVITEAIATGRFPKQQVEYGKRAVTARFATSNVYFVLDKLIGRAVKQIQSAMQKLGNAIDIIPGMNAISGLVNLFIKIYLGYVDECCLGYTFYKRKQNAYKSAADGVVIYAQNWKKMLKDALKTTGIMILAVVVVVLVIFLILGLLFRLFGWSGTIAFLMACLITWAVKDAFIDSYIMIRVMHSYLNLVPQTQITFDLYGKFSAMSSSLKELIDKGRTKPAAGQADAPAPRTEDVDADSSAPAPRAYRERPAQRAANPAERPQGEVNRRPAPRPVFCEECGAKNAPRARFCAECGAEMTPRAASNTDEQY